MESNDCMLIEKLYGVKTHSMLSLRIVSNLIVCVNTSSNLTQSYVSVAVLCQDFTRVWINDRELMQFICNVFLLTEQPKLVYM